MRDIVRPNSIGRTPRRLKTALGARRTVKVSDVVTADYQQDLFLAYPEPTRVINRPPDYRFICSFYQSNKVTQRTVLQDLGLPIVPMFNLRGNYERFVVRPLRHSQGRDYRITADVDDFNASTHYISALIPKDKEFRVLFYKGQHVCTYLKQNPNNIPASEPWTHANGCTFATINNPQNDKVHRLGLLDQLKETSLAKFASLVAFDVLAAGNTLYVCEANLCPGLTITGTIDKIVAIENSL